jgi:hypothetical protein
VTTRFAERKRLSCSAGGKAAKNPPTIRVNSSSNFCAGCFAAGLLGFFGKAFS